MTAMLFVLMLVAAAGIAYGDKSQSATYFLSIVIAVAALHIGEAIEKRRKND